MAVHTLSPVEIYSGDATFTLMLRDWVERHAWNQQQDAGDFAWFIIPALMPCFFSGKWLPRWAADPAASIVDEELDEKGDTFTPISISICLPVPDFTLQDFVSMWHDVHGHQRVLLGMPIGTCIHLEPHYHKDQAEVYISDFCCLPCYTEGCVKWIPYHTVAVAFHTGKDYRSGHWQTSLWQGNPHRRWLHYDDGKIPQVGLQITQHMHETWSLVWLALDPRYS